MSKPPKRPRDPNQLGKLIADIASGVVPRDESGKDPLAVELGRRGGLKGGKARKAALSPERLREIALKANKARWSKDK